MHEAISPRPLHGDRRRDWLHGAILGEAAEWIRLDGAVRSPQRHEGAHSRIGPRSEAVTATGVWRGSHKDTACDGQAHQWGCGVV